MTDVAIVTGGAGGIGQAINRRLAEAGYTVVAGDLADMLAKDDPSGDDIHPVEMDVRDQAVRRRRGGEGRLAWAVCAASSTAPAWCASRPSLESNEERDGRALARQRGRRGARV